MQENEPLRIPAAWLSAMDVAKVVATKKFDVRRSLNGEEFELTSRGWIGQFPLNAAWLLRIDPKVPVHNIFWMLDVAYEFSTFQFWKEISTQVETLPEMFSRLATVFLGLVSDRVRRGICCGYTRVRDEMALVRGRVDIGASILSSTRSLKLMCDFEEHTTDIPDNQILLFALDLISRLNILSTDKAAIIRRVRREMLHRVTLRAFSGSECIGRPYNRLTADYRSMHRLARLFIENVGPGLNLGAHEALPFAIHFPTLFERFVAQWLRAAAPSDLEFIPKLRLAIDSTHDVEIEVDLVCRDRQTSKVLAVLDTKYKAAQKPSRSDLSQLALYSLRTGTNRAFLVYPSSSNSTFSARVGGVTIESLAFDIGARPRPDGESFLRTLIASLGRN